MAIKNRLAKLEKRKKGSDKKTIFAVDNSGDPDRVTVEGQDMTRAEFDALAAQAGDDMLIFHIMYTEDGTKGTRIESQAASIYIPDNGRE
jgi:hypothetical protein